MSHGLLYLCHCTRCSLSLQAVSPSLISGFRWKPLNWVS